MRRRDQQILEPGRRTILVRKPHDNVEASIAFDDLRNDAASRKTFQRFCEAFSLTHLLEDERFVTNAARVNNRQLVTDTLTPVMQQHPTLWWIEKLEALKIGCGPINKLSEVFADPHVQARNMVLEMAHATGEMMKVIANPVKLSETPADYRLPPPVLGQHTDAILGEQLGMGAAELKALREKGVI